MVITQVVCSVGPDVT